MTELLFGMETKRRVPTLGPDPHHLLKRKVLMNRLDEIHYNLLASSIGSPT